MPNEPLGISFSPFNRQRNGPSPTNYGAPAAPQEPTRFAVFASRAWSVLRVPFPERS